MRCNGRLLGMAASAAMLITSASATASTPPPNSPPAANPWMTLSMLNSAGAAALGGTAAAAQPAYPTPDEAGSPPGVGGIPWPVIAVWLAVIALDIYIVTSDDNDNEELTSPE